MAFRFVARITDLEPGRRARGELFRPIDAPIPCPALLAEGVGQLAGWLAMAATGFRRRPIAGLAREVAFRGTIPSSGQIELEVEAHEIDEEAVTYSGTAKTAAGPIVELRDCVGPMLPIEEFEDPLEARHAFEHLRTDGERIGWSIADLPAEALWNPLGRDGSRCHRAELRVPATAGLFADHFPRRSVFPGTLLLDAAIGFATPLAAEALEANTEHVAATSVHDVKLVRFLPPGSELLMTVEIAALEPRRAVLAVRAEHEGRRVATARIAFSPRVAS